MASIELIVLDDVFPSLFGQGVIVPPYVVSQVNIILPSLGDVVLLVVSKDEINVLLQYLLLLSYPFLAHLHDLGNSYVVVFRVQQNVVVEGIWVDVGLDKVQPVLLVLLVLRELYTKFASFAKVLQLLLLVLVDLVLSKHEQLLENSRLYLEDGVMIQKGMQFKQGVQRNLLLIQRLKRDLFNVLGQVEDG